MKHQYSDVALTKTWWRHNTIQSAESLAFRSKTPKVISHNIMRHDMDWWMFIASFHDGSVVEDKRVGLGDRRGRRGRRAGGEERRRGGGVWGVKKRKAWFKSTIFAISDLVKK
jgi:hypothetical protein